MILDRFYSAYRTIHGIEIESFTISSLPADYTPYRVLNKLTEGYYHIAALNGHKEAVLYSSTQI